MMDSVLGIRGVDFLKPVFRKSSNCEDDGSACNLADGWTLEMMAAMNPSLCPKCEITLSDALASKNEQQTNVADTKTDRRAAIKATQNKV